MSAALVGKRSDCIYRCTYRKNSHWLRGFAYPGTLSSKINSCKVQLLTVNLEVPLLKGSSGTKFGWCGGEVGGEINGVSSLKLFVRRSTAMSGQKYLYTIPQTAELLGLSKTTVYELIGNGELLAVHPTTAARISDSSIAAFVRTLEERERSNAKALRKQFV